MVDIEAIEKLENTAMLERIEREKLNQEDDQRRHRESHANLLLEIEAGKADAEKEIPKLLAQMQEEISYAIRNKRHNISFKCGDGSYEAEWKLLYIKILLCQMLPLKGLACKLSEEHFNNIIVSW